MYLVKMIYVVMVRLKQEVNTHISTHTCTSNRERVMVFNASFNKISVI